MRAALAAFDGPERGKVTRLSKWMGLETHASLSLFRTGRRPLPAQTRVLLLLAMGLREPLVNGARPTLRRSAGGRRALR